MSLCFDLHSVILWYSSFYSCCSSCRYRKFNVVPLKNTSFVSQFADDIVYLITGKWNNDADGLAKWGLVRDGLLDASDKMLGFSRRH